MNDIIQKVIFSAGIFDWGVCRFSSVADKLLSCRAKNRIPENAQSVLLLLFPYKVKEERPENISRYAAVPDYHRVCGKYLEEIKSKLSDAFPDNRFEAFIDNSPIPEVYAAALAGLGVIGENRLLINKKYGSWCFIGEIVTDLKIYDENCQNEHPKKCSLCGDCKRACPSGLHGGKCLSAVSQQKKDLSEDDLTALRVNNIVWGCDLCAEICPLNKNVSLTYIKEFTRNYRDRYVAGEDITGRAMEWRGEKTVLRNAENLSSKK